MVRMLDLVDVGGCSGIIKRIYAFQFRADYTLDYKYWPFDCDALVLLEF